VAGLSTPTYIAAIVFGILHPTCNSTLTLPAGVACNISPRVCHTLTTLFCSKPAGNDQWWELIDAKSGRPYYYNASTKQTVWVRPATGDIVALAKLQQAQKAMLAEEQELKAKEERAARLKQQQLEAAMQQQQAAPGR
jgi:hypothetical protein